MNIKHSQSVIDNFIDEDFSIPLVRISDDGVLLNANNSFIRMFGFTSLDDFNNFAVNNNDIQKCLNISRFLNSIKRSPLKTFWLKKDGTKILMKETFNVYKSIEGNVYIDCSLQDITKKSLIEEIFADLESVDYSILKSIPDPILILSKEGVILECKNNVKSILPGKEQLAGNSVKSFFSSDIANKMLEKVNLALSSGDAQSLVFELENSFGIKFYEARFAMLSCDEVVMILREITEQISEHKSIERIAQELLESNTTKDKFFSIIGHDLRTPLNGLMGYAEILFNEYDNLTKEEIKEFAGHIIEITQSTNNLLNNILEWSRLQNGKIAFYPKICNFKNISQKIVNVLQASAANKGIKIFNRIDDCLEVFIDSNMISSILINLISNAIKFSNFGGTIEINSKILEEMIIVSVSDKGIGIKPEDLCKIFDPKVSFSTAGTAKEKGTGLGLLLCKEFTKFHKGNIWTESELGKGTTFSFSIPVDKSIINSLQNN